jgi:hypothetical protein
MPRYPHGPPREWTLDPGSPQNKLDSRPHFPEAPGLGKAVWPETCGPVLGRFSAKLGPKTFLERRVSSCSADCTKHQPGRPIIMPFRGAEKLRPACFQVPSIEEILTPDQAYGPFRTVGMSFGVPQTKIITTSATLWFFDSVYVGLWFWACANLHVKFDSTCPLL